MSTPTESETPRTLRCFRDGTWHAAQQRIAELEKLLADANRGAERNARVNAIMAKDLMEAKLRIAELEEDKA